MAVSKPNIKAALEALYTAASTGAGITPEAFADEMAEIIKDAILSADVNTNLTAATANVTTTAPAGTWPVIGGSSTGGLT